MPKSISQNEEALDTDDDTDDDAGSGDAEPGSESFRVEITAELDLHTFAPRDAKAVVEEYLREAYGRGFRCVRIVHGKGIGVQREMVRAVLARTPFVQSFQDAPGEAGGWGATIVWFASR